MHRRDGQHYGWRDLLMVLLAAALYQVSVEHRQSDADTQRSAPGSLEITLHWPDGHGADVDLWVKCPLDDKPVGYSNKTSGYCTLDRDDRGDMYDMTRFNYEIVRSRGTPAGTYTIDAHLFLANGDPPPEPVEVEAWVTSPEGTRYQLLLGDADGMARADLRAAGEETTLVRFALDERGDLVPGSVDHLFLGKLRSKR